MSTLSEAYRDHPLPRHHIIPLDFNSVNSVPDSHIWPNSDTDAGTDLPSSDHNANPLTTSLSVPVIDLEDPNVTQLISLACENWGVFLLVNHGIQLNILKDAEAEARRLFSLPTRRKLKALRCPGGATGYGIARITPFFDKYMWHEGFTIMGSPLDHAVELWPHGHSRFCDVMETYQNQMKALAERLTKLILRSLNIPDEDTKWVGSGCTTALQLNSYPSCPNPNQTLGLAPHTDTSLLTILHQSSVSGLQIVKEGVGWISVLPGNGALVVNVGDLLHIMSNGRFCNVLHRVFVNQSQQRLSVAYFYNPPINYSIMPELNYSGQDAVYHSVTVKEYICIKAKSLDKALSVIRI